MIRSIGNTVICSAVLLAFAGTACAATNLVPNGDFNNGTTGWSLEAPYSSTNATISVVSDGNPPPGLQVLLSGGGGAAYVWSECIAVDPGHTYAFSADFGSDNSEARLAMALFDNSDCSGIPDGSINGPAETLTGGFQALQLNPDYTVHSPIHGVRVTIIYQSSAANVAALDNVDFELATEPVTLQSFQVQ